jgi:hypothetical protein
VRYTRWQQINKEQKRAAQSAHVHNAIANQRIKRG